MHYNLLPCPQSQIQRIKLLRDTGFSFFFFCEHEEYSHKGKLKIISIIPWYFQGPVRRKDNSIKKCKTVWDRVSSHQWLGHLFGYYFEISDKLCWIQRRLFLWLFHLFRQVTTPPYKSANKKSVHQQRIWWDEIVTSRGWTPFPINYSLSLCKSLTFYVI